MALTDLSSKVPGNPILAQDWNDVVKEVVRLDGAKVNKLVGDNIAGPLTIASALGVGTTTPATTAAKVHVLDTAKPAVLRLQTAIAGFGAARVELWSDAQGSATEWRPSYIESYDAGGFTGGLRIVTNGTTQANRQASVEQVRFGNGVTGFGVTDPGFRIDAAGRIRIRQGTAALPTAGIYFHHATPNNNRAFVGMANDNEVGFWGETGGGWALRVDTTTGNTGLRLAPTAASALTVGGNLWVLSSPAAGANPNNPAILRLQNTLAFGPARMEFWSDPSGGANEWRPGYIESADTGGFNGGLKFFTNGGGAGNKVGSAEQMRVTNGGVGIGGVEPGAENKLDVNGRIRLRQGGRSSAGIWLYQDTPANDRAFVGMRSDNEVGFWGNTGIGWGLYMDTATGNVTCAGKVDDNKYSSYAYASGATNTSRGAFPGGSALSWVQINGMFLAFTIRGAANRDILITFSLPGVQITGASNAGQASAYFRLVIDSTQVEFTRGEWNNNGWELRNVYLMRRWTLTPGAHSVQAQWALGENGGTVTGCWYNEGRMLHVQEI